MTEQEKSQLLELRTLATSAYQLLEAVPSFADRSLDTAIKMLSDAADKRDRLVELLDSVQHLLPVSNISIPGVVANTENARSACEGLPSLLFEIWIYVDLLDRSDHAEIKSIKHPFAREFGALRRLAQEEVNQALVGRAGQRTDLVLLSSDDRGNLYTTDTYHQAEPTDTPESDKPELRFDSTQQKKPRGKFSKTPLMMSAMVKHHQYSNGEIGHVEPMTLRQLMRLSGVASTDTARAFINKYFGSTDAYKLDCRSGAAKLLINLRIFAGEGVWSERASGRQPPERAVEYDIEIDD